MAKTDDPQDPVTAHFAVSLRYGGNVLAAVVLAVFIFVFGLAAYQLDNWRTYFYRGSIDIGPSCKVATMATPSRERPVDLAGGYHRDIRVPHVNEPLFTNVAPPGSETNHDATWYHAHYRCAYQPTGAKSPGLAYLHVGWLFASSTEILINGSTRAAFDGLDRPAIPLTAADLAAPQVTVEVWTVGKPSPRFGLTGAIPMAIATGTVTNARIFATESAVTTVRDLYTLLPALTLALFLLLGWWSGQKSHLTLATLLYLTLCLLRNINVTYVEFWPWPKETAWHLHIPLTFGANLAFAFFGAQLLRLAPGRIGVMVAAGVTLLISEATLLLLAADPWPLEVTLARANNVASASLAALLARMALSRSRTADGEQSRRVNRVFSALAIGFSLVMLADVGLSTFRASFRLSRYMELTMPLFVGSLMLYALAQFEQRFHTERQKRQKMEADLEVAREIQDSLAPPPAQDHDGQLDVRCLQLKHSTVAGDWMAVRKLENGTLLAVVADATGKGVQAALVTHAVQSLWADALGQEGDFDPEAWIQRVNRTLVRLGEKKPHSLTLGIALMSPARVTYWSAGHIPLFVVTGSGDQQQVRPLSGKGQVLGLKSEVLLASSSMDLPATGPIRILLGTDGVFERGTRTSKREVLAFVDAVDKNAAAAMEALAADDDKTIVLIGRTARAESA